MHEDIQENEKEVASEQPTKELSAEEIADIEQQRTAYTQALEGRDGGISGKVRQIISSLRGGKLSDRGELLMLVDAERQNQLHDAQAYTTREEAVRDRRGLARDDVYGEKATQILEKYEKSYLTVDIIERPKHIGQDKIYPFRKLRGTINGQQIEITLSHDDLRYRPFTYFRGMVNGEEILEDDLRAIWHEYEEIAGIQISDAIYAHTDEEIADEKRKQMEEADVAAHEAERSKSLRDSLGK